MCNSLPRNPQPATRNHRRVNIFPAFLNEVNQEGLVYEEI